MCNNNGACRASAGGVMCPSYRVTREERDVTRGRANSLRLAITGQLGPDALTSDEMAETLKLCVSCKGCRRECPTGVDMARMKIEVQAARAEKYGLSLHDRLVGYLPRYAPYAAKVPWLLNLARHVSRRGEIVGGDRGFQRAAIAAALALGCFRRPRRVIAGLDPAIHRSSRTAGCRKPRHDEREVVLFADTFNRYFERENLDAALAVLNAGGYRVHVAKPVDGSSRPLCCGRTFLSIGKVDEARREAERTLAALEPFVSRGVPVIGLEPSCLLSFRDEVPGDDEGRARAAARRAGADLRGIPGARGEGGPARSAAQEDRRPRAGARPLPSEGVRRLQRRSKPCSGSSPVSRSRPIESSCCGMAGSFGYAADTIDVSLAMGELSLLPAVRKADADTLIVADGTSCRHQIHDGTGREAIHVARVLAMSLQ